MTRTLPESINPLTTFTLVTCFSLIGLVQGPLYLGLASLGALILVYSAGKLKSFLLVIVTAVLPAAALMFLLQFFFTQGEHELLSWWIFSGTQEGLDNAIKFVSRFLVIGIGVLTAIHLIELRKFSRALEQIGLSPRATYVLQSTFLITPELRKRASTILDAQRARGIETDAGVRTRMAALLPAVAPLILSSLTSVEERAMSLEARGMSLSGEKTSLLIVPDNVANRSLRWMAVLLTSAYLVWRIWW